MTGTVGPVRPSGLRAIIDDPDILRRIERRHNRHHRAIRQLGIDAQGARIDSINHVIDLHDERRRHRSPRHSNCQPHDQTRQYLLDHFPLPEDLHDANRPAKLRQLTYR